MFAHIVTVLVVVGLPLVTLVLGFIDLMLV